MSDATKRSEAAPGSSPLARRGDAPQERGESGESDPRFMDAGAPLGRVSRFTPQFTVNLPSEGRSHHSDPFGKAAMKTWSQVVLLNLALTASAILACSSHPKSQALVWRVNLIDYSLVIALHLALVLGSMTAALYRFAGTAGLADFGKRVNLVKRSIRRGEGEPELCQSPPARCRGRVGVNAKTSPIRTYPDPGSLTLNVDSLMEGMSDVQLKIL